MSNIFSDVKIYPVQGNAVVLARGEVIVHKTLKVKFTVMNGSNGRFVSLPSEKGAKPDEATGKTKYFPLVSLVNRELQDELNKVVLGALDGNKEESTSSAKPVGKKPVGDGIPF